MSNENELSEGEKEEARKILFRIQYPEVAKLMGNIGSSNSSNYLSSDEFKYRDFNPPSFAGKLLADDCDFLNSLNPLRPNYNPFKKAGF